MRETTWLLSQAQAMALGSSFARAAYLSLRCNQPLLLPGGLPSDHPGSSTTLNRRTTQDPLTALAIVISPPTSRSVVASPSAPDTQPTALVCWATQLFIRSRHVASVTQSRVALPAARYEFLEHRR